MLRAVALIIALSIIVLVIAQVLVALLIWRWLDKRADYKVWANLVATQPTHPDVFDPAMVDALPAPAARFFRFAIQPGTPLHTVARLSMTGQISLGDKAKPNFIPMTAEQILAAPRGFVWQLNAGAGARHISGSDAAVDTASWSRFWWLGLAPVARAGGNHDHALSAFGRYVAEAVLWSPAAVLPGKHIQWTPVSDATARLTLRYMGLEQAVDLTVDRHGRPEKIVFQRWSNANPDKIFQRQPFGAYLSEFKEYDGFKLPTRVEAGNFFETDHYFPFYRVTVTSVRF